MTASWFNVLLIFVPVCWALEFSHQGHTLVFVFAMLAIIPLASLLGFATEQLALRVGDTLGGLMVSSQPSSLVLLVPLFIPLLISLQNATFGNAVELLISILALVKGELDIVQASMIGSILSNTLLVLGMCFTAGASLSI